MSKEKALFWTFRQNNSGGTFTVDDSVDKYVIVEALDAEEANEKAKKVGIYFNGCDKGVDCRCCGDRWYRASLWEAYEEPALYGVPVNKFKDYIEAGVIIYFLNGEVKRIKIKKGSNEERDYVLKSLGERLKKGL